MGVQISALHVRRSGLIEATAERELLHHGFERLGADAGAELPGYESGWHSRHLEALEKIVEGQTRRTGPVVGCETSGRPPAAGQVPAGCRAPDPLGGRMGSGTRTRARSVLVATALVFACSEGLHRGAEYPSPSARYVVSFFGLSGGGAAGWAHEYVGVRPAARPFDPASRVLEMDHGYEVCFIWESDTQLVVEYPVEAEILSFVRSVRFDQALRISHRSRPSTQGLSRDRACPGCLARLGAAGGPWSPCVEVISAEESRPTSSFAVVAAMARPQRWRSAPSGATARRSVGGRQR